MPTMDSDSLLIDKRYGFHRETNIYHSPRLEVLLPPENAPISFADYALSLLKSGLSSKTAALIDASTNRRICYTELVHLSQTLAVHFQTRVGLSRGDSAYILSPNSIQIPIIYFALFLLGVVISPSNPASTKFEISRQIKLCRPVVAFATTSTAHKIPPLQHGTILLDSPEFDSMTTMDTVRELRGGQVLQSDPATILYSSGTTGDFKGVVLTHRNLTAMVATAYANRTGTTCNTMAYCTVPLFHAYGLGYCVRTVAFGESLVCMERFDLGLMGKTIERLRVTHVALAPPTVVAMIRNDCPMNSHDLSSLKVVACGGAPLSKAAVKSFVQRFPNVQLAQAYGLTESTGGVTRTLGPEETQRLGASGRLMSNCQAKIVDPDNGICLPPLKPGELWIRGPIVMRGYVDDKDATEAVVDPEGWLRTGDLCYFDNEGFLFFIERIKELIKYRGYQVAPGELEQLLLSHPQIVDAAVIPYPNDEAGELPMAFVVRQSGSNIDEFEIKDFIAKQVAPYKKIRRVSFVNCIPKNAQGKVLRKDLVKLALSNAKL